MTEKEIQFFRNITLQSDGAGGIALRATDELGADLRFLFNGGLIRTQKNTGTEAAPIWVPFASIASVVFGAKGGVSNAKSVFVSANEVDAGASGVVSTVVDSTDTLVMEFTGALPTDITVVGPGGLQTGESESADEWLQHLIIGDTTLTNAPNTLFLPDGVAFNESGFDVFRRTGWVRNDGSLNFIDFETIGNGRYRTIMWRNVSTDRIVLAGGAATVPTAIDCSELVPPTSKFMHAALEQNGSPTINLFLSAAGVLVASLSKQQAIAGPLLVDSSQQVFYENTTGAGNVDFVVRGYVDEV